MSELLLANSVETPVDVDATGSTVAPDTHPKPNNCTECEKYIKSANLVVARDTSEQNKDDDPIEGDSEEDIPTDEDDAGSLEDFVVDDESDESDQSEDEKGKIPPGASETDLLLNSLPQQWSRDEVRELVNQNGRPKRNTRAPRRFEEEFADDIAKVMLDDVPESELHAVIDDSDDDDEDHEGNEEEDESFHADDEDEDDDDDDDSDDEDEDDDEDDEDEEDDGGDTDKEEEEDNADKDEEEDKDSDDESRQKKRVKVD